MAFPPPLADNTVVEVIYRGDMEGQAILTTFHYRSFSVEAPAPAYNTAMTALHTAMGTNLLGMKFRFLSCVPENYLMRSITLQPVYPARRRAVAVAQTGAGLRPVASTTNLALSIQRSGFGADRRNVGRVQLPMAAQDASGGLVDAVALRVACIDFSADLFNNLSTLGPGAVIWEPVLWKRGDSAQTAVALGTATLKATVRSMRRRQVGLGI